MGNQTKTINAGPVGLKPKGAYNPSGTYTFLDCVLYNHDSWVCKAINANGEAIEITGQTPADGSQYWQALTDGGRAAVAVGSQMRSEFDTWFGATAAAGIRKAVADWFSGVQSAWTTWYEGVQSAWTEWFSDTLATGVRKVWSTWFSGRQSDWNTLSNNVTAATEHAENLNNHPPYIADGTQARPGDVSYWYIWDYTNQQYVKRNYAKGEDLNWSDMSAADKQQLYDAVIEEVEREGGFCLYPVDLDSVTTGTVFQKNSIICVDGVVYRAKQQTGNLPVTLLTEGDSFVTQVVNGHTVFIKANNNISSDWEVWLDASSDFRYKSIEARVAYLETIINA